MRCSRPGNFAPENLYQVQHGEYLVELLGVAGLYENDQGRHYRDRQLLAQYRAGSAPGMPAVVDGSTEVRAKRFAGDTRRKQNGNDDQTN